MPKVYPQKFRQSWLQDPLMKFWLEMVEGKDGPVPKCKNCEVLLRNHYGDLKKHIKTEKHKTNAKVKFEPTREELEPASAKLKSTPGKLKPASAKLKSAKLKLVSAELDDDDEFTGVYISDPPLDDSETDEQPPPRQRRTDTDALEQFGRYIAVLMRRLPEDVSNRMQAEFVTQIMQAQIKYDSARPSETMLETSRHVNGQSSFDDTQESDKLASLMLDVST